MGRDVFRSIELNDRELDELLDGIVLGPDPQPRCPRRALIAARNTEKCGYAICCVMCSAALVSTRNARLSFLNQHEISRPCAPKHRLPIDRVATVGYWAVSQAAHGQLHVSHCVEFGTGTVSPQSIKSGELEQRSGLPVQNEYISMQ